MAWFQRNDPSQVGLGDRWRSSELADIHYHLEVGGLLAGYFHSMAGGDMEVSMIKHDITYESGESTTLLIPGPTSFSPIVMSKGFGDYDIIWGWFSAASLGNIIHARRNGSITLNKKVPTGYEAVVRWDFNNAWLQKVTGFSYNQYTGSGTAKLKLYIVPESIEMVDP
jgi:phage tail-like protein